MIKNRKLFRKKIKPPEKGPHLRAGIFSVMQLKDDEKDPGGHGTRKNAYGNSTHNDGNQGRQHKDTKIFLVKIKPLLNPITKLDIDLIHLYPPFRNFPRSMKNARQKGTSRIQFQR